MSDLIAPVDIRSIPKSEESYENQLLALLADVRTELRILNTQIQIGLNLTVDADLLRKDPYYTES